MPYFIVGVRDGAADRTTVERAGFDVDRTTFAGYERLDLDPQRHYIRVTASDEAAAVADVAARLGWAEDAVALADVTVHADAT
jgi:hypothetical protein